MGENKKAKQSEEKKRETLSKGYPNWTDPPGIPDAKFQRQSFKYTINKTMLVWFSLDFVPGDQVPKIIAGYKIVLTTAPFAL